jgi:hypothetical protein
MNYLFPTQVFDVSSELDFVFTRHFEFIKVQPGVYVFIVISSVNFSCQSLTHRFVLSSDSVWQLFVAALASIYEFILELRKAALLGLLRQWFTIFAQLDRLHYCCSSKLFNFGGVKQRRLRRVLESGDETLDGQFSST